MLITLEGLPGAGKTTQAEMLAARLTARGLAVSTLPDLAQHNTDGLGAVLVELFASSADPFRRHRDAVTETFLAAALRAHLTATAITPAAADPAVLIEDRGIHTFQSYALAGLTQHHHITTDQTLRWLDTLTQLTGGPPAGTAVWLRLPVEEAISRAEDRDRRRYTLEQRAYLHRVHHAYDELTRHDPALHIIEVDGKTSHEVHELVHATISAPEPGIAATRTGGLGGTARPSTADLEIVE